MQIDRHVERGGTLEDAPERRLVEEAAARETVDHGAPEAEPRHGAVELRHRGGRIRRRQRRQAREAIGMRPDRLEQEVVDLARRGNCRRRIERLAARLVVGEDLHAYPGRVHGGDPFLAEIEELSDDVKAKQLLAIAAAMRPGRKTLLLTRQNEVLLERNDPHAW